MRMTVSLTLAAALAASSPALAQDANTTADVNATDITAVNAADANSDVTAVTTNDVAVPAAEPVATDTATVDTTTEKKSGGFPWGVLGLLGLIGLIPRKGR
jgi:hypothetical protein